MTVFVGKKHILRSISKRIKSILKSGSISGKKKLILKNDFFKDLK